MITIAFTLLDAVYYSTIVIENGKCSELIMMHPMITLQKSINKAFKIYSK